jgi:hypothetical protein
MPSTNGSRRPGHIYSFVFRKTAGGSRGDKKPHAIVSFAKTWRTA